MKLSLIVNSKNNEKGLFLVLPFLLFVYSFFLFTYFGHDLGLVYWRPARNMVFVLYIAYLFVTVFLGKFKKNSFSVKNINLILWFVGMSLSVFSWAIGGFVFDLIRIFQSIQ